MKMFEVIGHDDVNKKWHHLGYAHDKEGAQKYLKSIGWPENFIKFELVEVPDPHINLVVAK